MTLKARKDICGNCLFHEELGGNNGEQRRIECRFNPPTLFMQLVPVGPAPGMLANPQGQRQVQMGSAFMAAFPTLDPEKWCGKHAPEVPYSVTMKPGQPPVEIAAPKLATDNDG